MVDEYFRLALYYFIVVSSVAMGVGLLRTRNIIGRLWGISMLTRGVEFTFLAILLMGIVVDYRPILTLRGALLTGSSVLVALANAALIWKFQTVDRGIKYNGDQH